MARRILLIGSTGLVGGLVVDRLAAAGEHVHALLRRPSGRSRSETVAPPEDWPALTRQLGGDVAICAIGTTMRVAGSETGFRAVDLVMAVAFAAAARAAGIPHMIAVSSVGADARSRNFYLRIKGEMENALESLGFGRLDIVRPGLLRGNRGSDRRLGERLAILVSPLLNVVLRGRLDRYAAIDASIVANGIAAMAAMGAHGTFVHHNRAIRHLAGA